MKKGKKLTGVLLAAAIASVLTGCVDNMPELTEEQSQLIAEYAADLLMEYSPNYGPRVVDVEESAEETTQETFVEDADEEDAQEVKETETEEADEKIPETEAVQVQPQDVDFAEEMQLDAFTLQYAFCDICDSYPKDASGYRVSAGIGNELLIVHFDLTNVTQEKQECGIYKKSPSFKVTTQSGTVKSMTTMLDNDFTTFINTLDAGETEDVVVIFELSAEQAASEHMTLQYETIDITIK